MGSLRVRQELRRSLVSRGSYMVQPEMDMPTITDEGSGETYMYIDRNFMSFTDDNEPRFMGGFRSLMPTNSVEAQYHRNHGNGDTVWGQIVS